MKTELSKELNWELDIQEVQIANKADKSKVAICRSDNGELLNICSNQYRPFYNAELKNLVHEITTISDFRLEGFQEFGNGKRILAFLKNNKQTTLGNQAVKDFLIIGNSHDTTSKVFAGMSNYMFRCENQFTSDLYPLRLKHINDQHGNVIDPKTIIKNYLHNREQLDLKVSRMMTVTINNWIANQMVDRLLMKLAPEISSLDYQENERKRKVEIMNSMDREINDLGMTIWGFYNGITHYTSNVLKGKQGFGNTNGLGGRINKMAWEICQRMLEQNRNLSVRLK